MGVVAVIGNETRLRGWTLAGVLVCAADTPDEARRVWADLSQRTDVTVVLVDPAVAAGLTAELAATPAPGSAPLVAELPT
jgi:vacuolar-type H+-ATPase subunit F/Vma7